MRAISLLFHDVYASDPGGERLRLRRGQPLQADVADFDAQLAGVDAVRRRRPAPRERDHDP